MGAGSAMGLIASPAGTLATGAARSLFSNMRRKNQLRRNQEWSDKEWGAIEGFYNEMIPFATDAAQQYADRTASLGNNASNFFASEFALPHAGPGGGGFAAVDPEAWLAANPAPVAPTLKDPGSIKFNQLMPRGARDKIRGKVGKKNETKQAMFDAAQADWESRKAAVEAAAAEQATVQADEKTAGDKVLDAWRTRQEEIDAENKALLESVKGGYEERYKRGMETLKGRGEQAKKDIDREFKASGGAIQAGARNRGLYNTTVLTSMEQGNENSRIAEQGRLEDRLRGEQIGLDKELSGDTLDAESTLGRFAATQKMQVTGDTIANLDGQRREALMTMLQRGDLANDAMRQVAATKLGLSDQFLRDTLDWYESQKGPVGEYSPLLDAVPAAAAAYTEREAQRAAERAARDARAVQLGTFGVQTAANVAMPFLYAGAFGGGGGGGSSLTGYTYNGTPVDSDAMAWLNGY